ncbi:Uncharacterized conserved protein YecE, DUF72 family [Fervidobacterium changbaicum]|nr:DUF72 domain-containing protein [Fervidobacterium changbaicum]SDH50310.1 Uncharacterized conserved protein YecE, DUF72 family [Fervidobacterium changbaicum]
MSLTEKNMTWFIGTSGFSFSDWVGTVYPDYIKPGEMFTYYWQHYGFNAVELNYTFYQMPSYRTIVSLLRKSPPGFKYAVKLHGSITHEKNLENVQEFLRSTDIIKQEGKLIGYLAQFPYMFKYSKENVDFLKRLAETMTGAELFIEFRSSTWVERDDIVLLIQEFESQVHVVVVDLPKLPGLYPFNTFYNIDEDSTYIRLHGRNSNWFTADEKTRYDYNYSDSELREIADEISSLASSKRFVFFNNCYRGQALKNALLFRTLVGGEKIGIF